MIDQIQNYDSSFNRDAIVGVLRFLNNKIRWKYHFTSNTRTVEVPFYYSYTGDHRFMMDAFLDDIPGDRPELNYDQIPRGVVTLNSWNIKSDEFANPNVWTYRNKETDDGELRRYYTRLSAIPIKMQFSVEIVLNSENDVFMCSQRLIETFFPPNNFLHFEYDFIRINGFLVYPDSKQITIPRTLSLAEDHTKKITFDIELDTYMPVWREGGEIMANKRVRWDAGIWGLGRSYPSVRDVNREAITHPKVVFGFDMPVSGKLKTQIPASSTVQVVDDGFSFDRTLVRYEGQELWVDRLSLWRKTE